MTIKRGEPWGAVGPPPDGLVTVGSDAELTAIVDAHRRAGEPIPVLGLLAGDLCRAVGGRGDAARFRGAEVALLPVDSLRVEIETDEGHRCWWGVAHVLVRRRWWRRRVVAAMNGQFLGRWDVVPRAHPNDGRVDVLEVDPRMPFAERWKAWRRLPMGAHLPHPMLRTRQVRELELVLDRREAVYVDGHRLDLGRRRSSVPLRVVVEPDSLRVCV